MKLERRYRLDKASLEHQHEIESGEKWFAARMGDGSGTVRVPGSSTLVYVRPWGSSLPMVVGRGSAPEVENFPVRVGKSKKDKRLKVLGAQGYDGVYYPPGSDGVDLHAPTHALYGSDPVWIVGYQVTDLAVYCDGDDMIVKIYPGRIMISGSVIDVVYQTIDLTSKIPVAGSLFVLIYVDSDGAIQTADGDNVNLIDLNYTEIPANPAGAVSLAAVRIYAGQTVITNNVQSQDIIDLRWSNMMHSHSIDQTVAQIILYDYSEDEYKYYAATAAGLTAALAASANNDSVYIPDGYYTVNPSVPEGVAMVGNSPFAVYIYGTVTLADTGQVRSCTINNTASSAGAISGVVGAATDVSQIQDCIIIVHNTGAGDAYGVEFDGYRMDIKNVYLRVIADNAGASAICLYSSGAPTGDTEVHLSIFANSAVSLATAPAANWSVASGVVPKVYDCTWHDDYDPSAEIEPRVGDRSAFDCINYPEVHAADLAAGTPIQHLPESPDADDVPQWDGAKWIHVPLAGVVNFDDLADVDMAGVTDGQVPAYDSGTSTYIPYTPLTADDSHQHIIGEDHSDECNGVDDSFVTLLSFRENSVAVYWNGLRLQLYVDYDEAVTLDSITFKDTLPETGDTLLLDYMCTLADYQSLSALLLESGDFILSELGDHLLQG